MNKPVKLVIFDYSGTLSPESPRFARPENLLRALEESGLFSVGVTTPEIFWEEIVGPTWIEGSTTATGYKQVMAKRIEALGLAPGATETEIAAASSLFVDRFLAHSRIDPHWRSLFEMLTGCPVAAVIIATDHYAELTGTILRYLGAWDIPAQKAGEMTGPCFPILVANSADIGFWKADRRFWEALAPQYPPETVRSVLIIDDFGFNEAEGDIYKERSGIERRRIKTAATLGEVFQAGVEVIPFFLDSGESEDATALRIAETGEQIVRFLDSSDTKITPRK
jgi:hypothetical protein